MLDLCIKFFLQGKAKNTGGSMQPVGFRKIARLKFGKIFKFLKKIEKALKFSARGCLPKTPCRASARAHSKQIFNEAKKKLKICAQ